MFDGNESRVADHGCVLDRCHRLQAAGIDVPLGEIGAEIQEVMESYEIELDGTVYPSA